MAALLLGITLILWSLNLLALVAVSNTVLGIFALVTGIVWLVSALGVAVPAVPTYHRAPPQA